jgi:uncharacterized phage-associated protein
MIDFKFNLIKTTQVVTQFLQKNNGKMSYMKLIKLLYLVDREALLNWGRPLTGDKYFSMKHGPVLSNVLEIINDGEEQTDSPYWYEYITEPENFEIALKDDLPGTGKLSERELELIDKIDKEFKDFNRWEMVDICHDILPEWKNPGKSRTLIDIKEIFNAEHMPDEKIKEIEEEVENLNYAKELLSVED